MPKQANSLYRRVRLFLHRHVLIPFYRGVYDLTDNIAEELHCLGLHFAEIWPLRLAVEIPGFAAYAALRSVQDEITDSLEDLVAEYLQEQVASGAIDPNDSETSRVWHPAPHVHVMLIGEDGKIPDEVPPEVRERIASGKVKDGEWVLIPRQPKP